MVFHREGPETRLIKVLLNQTVLYDLSSHLVWCGAFFPSLCHGRSAFVFGGMDTAEFTDRNGGNSPRVIPKQMGDAGGLECKWYNYNCFKETDHKCKAYPDHPDCRFVVITGYTLYKLELNYFFFRRIVRI